MGGEARQTDGTMDGETPPRPTDSQRRWLRRGLDQPGGKLPLFDENGRRVDGRIVRACLARGWAEPWFANSLKPDWLVCKLTPAGRQAASPPAPDTPTSPPPPASPPPEA